MDGFIKARTECSGLHIAPARFMRKFQRLKRLYTHLYVLGTWWPEYREAWLAPTRRDGRPDRVLDAGSGQGELALEFKRFGVPVEYYGVDLAVGDASWEFNVSAIADLQRLPFRASSFDKIVCNQTLEHVDEPERAVTELVRVLRPGGRLFLSVPFIWELHQEPFDRYRFSSHALKYLIEKNGLIIDLIRPMGGYFTVLRYLLTSQTSMSVRWWQPWRTLASLANHALRVFDMTVGGPIFYLLDQFDREPKITLGYFVHLRRPGDTLALPDDPYCCPLCVKDGEAPLARGPNAWICTQCAATFEVRFGVPLLTAQSAYQAVTDRVTSRAASF